MRAVLLTAMFASQGLALVNVILQGRNLREFLDRTPVLASSMDLENFKAVAGGQMWAALAQAFLLLIAPGCFVWGLATNNLTPGDFVWILLPSVVVILIARSFRSIELRAWSIPTADEEMAAERDRIVRVWRTRPLPDW